MSVLSVCNLIKKYNKKPVTNDVSFQVNAGEIVGLLGPNGAGKTTAFYQTVGLIRPDSGKILFKNTDITKKTYGLSSAPWHRVPSTRAYYF